MNHCDTPSATNAESSPFVTYFQHVECEKCLRIFPFGLAVDISQCDTNPYCQVMSAVLPRALTTRQQSAVDVPSFIRTETVNRRPSAPEGEAASCVQRPVLAVAAAQVLDRE